MAQVIAKNKGTNDCIAIKMKHGTEYVELKREMNLQYEGSELQFATISRPSAYGEYHVLGKRATLLPFQTLRSARSGS